ncbi:hypothetical protein J1N51_03435 [Psychrosphaera ytuae]|uniref:DUF6957 domain-containing protein n=1 Tax=Psychrosphaera ytuae TaxID=2820710 RepID=A0A975DD69_9GAMM|nr:hypothetical protein [Psychrosphaera ytuae]QTH64539.1 hypothetical protein J1N51_03435 [Psychrosphaera ytuae]
MKTNVEDWQIVSVLDNGAIVGEVLWGICVDDSTRRFIKGDYIRTSRIVKSHNQLIETVSGNIYRLLGEGVKSHISITDIGLLRQGFSPQEIKYLNSTGINKQH